MDLPSQLPIPEAVLAIARRLEDEGFETWCVGGAVRDTLLGYGNRDFDLTTAARPDAVRRLFRHTVPLGIDHGTVAVLDRDRRPHEVTTFRRDVRTDGRHAVVEFGVSLEDDLARRDFTINAIAYHPFRHEWRDPFRGQQDLDLRVVKAVGDPERRFREDYLRILRALRFAARFDFAIDPATWAAAKASASGLARLSAERVRDEWMRGLETATRPRELVNSWRDVGALAVWLPEVGAVTPAHPNPEALDRLAATDPVLMTAYLSDDPAATLSRLRCAKVEIERGRRVGQLRGEWPDGSSPCAVRRWMAAVGSAVDDLVTIAEVERRPLKAAVEEVRRSGAPVALTDLAVTGSDLIAVGLEEGPRIGEVLQKLLGLVLEDPSLNEKATLMERAMSWLPDSTSGQRALGIDSRRPRGGK